MRRGFRSQHFFRVWIECDHDGRSVDRPGVFGGGGDDCLMAEMNAIEYPDRKEYGAR